MRASLKLCAAFLTAALPMTAFPGVAHAVNLIVLEARNIALRPGQAVDSTKPLPLKAGEHVSLISPTGTTIKLDGPSERTPDAALGSGVAASNVLALLVTQRQARVGEVGTTRGGIQTPLPEPWLLDATRPGTVCLREGQMAVLWRPNGAGEAQLSVSPSDRSWRSDTKWPAGADRIVLAEPAVIHSGSTYLVTINGSQSALRVEDVPTALDNDAMRAAWLAGKGCEAQAEALLGPAK